ncbi:MAG: HDOD domain-containing protein, partial [Planctomycetales bacterium]|nr:HDOD domain-containing protein [Planctomycetales bacterium]
ERVFGWTHAEAAGIMARQWNLPDGFAVLVESHLAVDHWASEADAEPGKLAVAMSALLPPTVDPTWHECASFENYYSQICPAGGPPLAELLG